MPQSSPPAQSSFAQILTQLSAGPSTGQYDAVLALSEDQTNALLAQQYAASGPGSACSTLQAATMSSTTYNIWSLDAQLGPPQLSFGNNQNATLTMEIVGGTLTLLSPIGETTNYEVSYCYDLAGGGGTISGVFELGVASGSVNTVGTVTIDFGGQSTWTINIPGISNSSPDGVALGQVVSAALGSSQIVYTAGTLAISAATPPVLNPQSFSVASYPASNGLPGYLLLLITTTGGTVGTVAPTIDLIPAGSSAALLISNAIIFNNILPAGLNSITKADPFSGNLAGNIYSTVAASTYSLTSSGPFQTLLNPQNPNSSSNPQYTSANSGGTTESVVIPLGGLSFSPSATGDITVSLSPQPTFDQSFIVTYPTSASLYDKIKSEVVGTVFNTKTLTVDNISVNVTGTLALTAGTGGAISNQLALEVYLTAPTSDGSLEADFTSKIGSLFNNQTSTLVQSALNSLTPPPIQTFCLENILFPSGGVIMNQIGAPCDLYAVGSIQPTITVTPATADLVPGVAQSFTASANGQTLDTVAWSLINPPAGTTIEGSTVTIPTSLSVPSTFLLSAVNTATDEASEVGYAILTTTPAVTQSFSVFPAMATVPFGQSLGFSLTGSSGATLNNTQATVSASVGTAEYAGGLRGGWTYTAPEQLQEACAVTLTVTVGNDTGSFTWIAAPTVNLALQIADTTVAPGVSTSFTLTGLPSGLTGSVSDAAQTFPLQWFALNDAGDLVPCAIVPASNFSTDKHKNPVLTGTITPPSDSSPGDQLTIFAMTVGGYYVGTANNLITIAGTSD